MKTFRDRCYKEMVGKAMSTDATPLWGLAKDTITFRPSPCPYPTSIRPILINLGPEALFCCPHFSLASIIDTRGHNKTPWFGVEAHGASREPLSRTRGLFYIKAQERLKVKLKLGKGWEMKGKPGRINKLKAAQAQARKSQGK